MEVDRQTLLYFIIMLIFITLPSGNDQPHSTREKETLITYQKHLRSEQEELANSTYTSGYGNVTGFHLSYQDLVDGHNETEWPLHRFNDKHHWREDEKFSLLPNSVSDVIKSFWAQEPVLSERDDKAYLLNISGQAFGEFKIHSVSDLKRYNFTLPDYLQKYYDSYDPNQNAPEDGEQESPLPPDPMISKPIQKTGNMTKSSGKISLQISAYDYNYRNAELSKFIFNETTDSINDTVVARVAMSLKDYDEIESHDLETRGVYFQETGALVTITRSAKFLGTHGLSHMTLNEKNFNRAKVLLGQYLNFTDNERDLNLDNMNNNILRSRDSCEMISYFQFEKTDYTKQELQNIDEELIAPSGSPIPKDLPGLKIKEFLLYSPDCGLLFQSKPGIEFIGLKSEIYNIRFRHVLIGLMLLIIIQLILFLRQIKETRTPGQLSTIATNTLYMIGFQDALVVFSLILFSSFSEDLYLILACVAVLAFVMSGIFEMRFIVNVMSTQVNERGTTWWQILRGGTAETTITDPTPEPQSTENTNEPLLPTTNPPANAPTTAATTTNTTPGMEESNIWNKIFGLGGFLTIAFTFLIWNSTLWRASYRKIFEYVGLILVNSFWIPQFLRNTLKNRRKSFSWEFVLGTSLVRLVPVIYICLEDNIGRHRYDPVLVSVLTSWLSFQILLLVLQSYMGPRFWVNEKWLPKAYDYQKILHIKDLEHNFSSELLANIKPNEGGNEEQDKGIIECKCTCPICMTDISLPILTKDGDESRRRKINNKLYMITPCYHIFHSECLESWMKYKLQCPVCRESLPPI
ncbi:hypothetical protein G9P44_005652 [Scheffersomyces stipitis]|nr:hypothetical protein G9P44_005652 [Scheffersomyces stipitis]